MNNNQNESLDESIVTNQTTSPVAPPAPEPPTAATVAHVIEPNVNTSVESIVAPTETQNVNPQGYAPIENVDRFANKKVLSKEKMLFHLILSLCVWEFISYTLLKIVISVLIEEVVGTSDTLYIGLYGLAWALADVFTICGGYFFNKKYTVADESLNFIKNFVEVVFIGGVLILNFGLIKEFFMVSPIITIIVVLVHLLAIDFFNKRKFNKHIK